MQVSGALTRVRPMSTRRPVDSDLFATTLAAVGVVILAATLLSGLIEKTGLPHVAVFLGMGALLGPYGVGQLHVGLDSPILRVVSTLSLALVLFTDAITLDLNELRRHVVLALRVLGPGTILSGALTALAGWLLLDITPASAAILGAALASTDPVLLRGLIKRQEVPTDARMALRLESGLNDAVLLPVIFIAMTLMGGDSGAMVMLRQTANVFLLGPLVGVVVGFLAVLLLEVMRKRTGIRRDYESIYSLGVAFTAFALGEAVHGSGFLSAFAAGLTILVRDVELCDCFVEYGETTAEMALLFTFVLFGVSTIWSGLEVISPATVAFTVLALVVRPLVFPLALMGSGMQPRGRWIVSWFGPRGLSSLLLVLIPVFAGVPGAPRLLSVCSLVVLTSVVVHGASLMLLAHSFQGEADAPLRPVKLPEKVSIDALVALQAERNDVVVADVRTSKAARASEVQIQGALRLRPSHAVDDVRAANIPLSAPIILYCA